MKKATAKNKVANYRVYKNLTQKELCKAVNISINQLRDIEIRGKVPKVQVMLRLSEFFNVSMNQLFLVEEE